jgi:hypothetical protein
VEFGILPDGKGIGKAVRGNSPVGCQGGYDVQVLVKLNKTVKDLLNEGYRVYIGGKGWIKISRTPGKGCSVDAAAFDFRLSLLGSLGGILLTR